MCKKKEEKAELHQSSWKLAEMGRIEALRPISPEFTITLHFEEVRVHGASACNRYFANYHVDEAQLRFQAIGSTRMMCSETAMVLERDYFAALERVETYQLQVDSLTLYCDRGESILRLVSHKE